MSCGYNDEAPLTGRFKVVGSSTNQYINCDYMYGDCSMKPSEILQMNRSAIRRVIELHHATNPRIFGSVLH
jgi:hypothetical protein